MGGEGGGREAGGGGGGGLKEGGGEGWSYFGHAGHVREDQDYGNAARKQSAQKRQPGLQEGPNALSEKYAVGRRGEGAARTEYPENDRVADVDASFNRQAGGEENEYYRQERAGPRDQILRVYCQLDMRAFEKR